VVHCEGAEQRAAKAAGLVGGGQLIFYKLKIHF
jgi:hypothetical protein